ncbi:MAG: hypothetical protein H6838_01065 [Planctomycetes bacterium]|nr:hypothetical protein [Planctomycetota bacterium]
MIFAAPHRIDTTATVPHATPQSWREALGDAAEVQVLRLGDPAATPMPGWCTAGGQLTGPEIEVMCGGINTKQPTHAAVWRQGNLLHWGFEPDPDHLEETGRKLFVNSVAYIARFVNDRPVVRVRSFADPAGGAPSMLWLDRLIADGDVEQLAGMFAEPWNARIEAQGDGAVAWVKERLGAVRDSGGNSDFTLDERALALGVDLRQRAVLRELVARLDGEQAETARALLESLVAGGPDPGTTKNNWTNWLRRNENALCWDAWSHVWRVDPLALWRRVDSERLRGPERADGGAIDARARELAAVVVARYGGKRALDDLHTISWRRGSVRYFWDRDAAVLRIENQAEIPAGNMGTPWQTVIFDTAADADLLMGGGPPPRPRVSGRGMFRDSVEDLMLPLLLLDPGTALRRFDDDDEGLHVLGVRLGMRGIDPTREVLLHLTSEGRVAWIDKGPSAASRTTRADVTATAQVGPLLLDAGFSMQGRRTTQWTYEELTWNPTAPAGLATEHEPLLGGR